MHQLASHAVPGIAFRVHVVLNVQGDLRILALGTLSGRMAERVG